MEEQQKALFTIQIPPDTEEKQNKGVVDLSKKIEFDEHLTKREFNHFLVTNLDNFAQVISAVIKKVSELEEEIKKLKCGDNNTKGNDVY